MTLVVLTINNVEYLGFPKRKITREKLVTMSMTTKLETVSDDFALAYYAGFIKTSNKQENYKE